MSIRHLVLILGDQLTLDNPALVGFDPTLDRILMVEGPQEAQHVWSHKARIALFLSAMRHFALTLDAHQMPCIYLKQGEHDHASLASAWAFYMESLKPKVVRVCQPGITVCCCNSNSARNQPIFL